jgi:hypothetical protein
MEQVFNIYGVALTADNFVAMFGNEKAFQEAIATKNNLAVRQYITGRGFVRVRRAFANAVMNKAA